MPDLSKKYKYPINEEPSIVNFNPERNFDHFFRKYYSALCYYAYTIMHEQEEAKDIVQDCFIKLWDEGFYTEQTNTIKNFLYTMVHHRCIDYIRKQAVRTKAAIRLQPKEFDERYFEQVTFAETMQEISSVIDQLPKKMQSVLRLYYLEGLKHKEIAEILDTTEDAVRVRKLRALKLLQEKLSFFLLTLSFAVFMSI